MKTLTGTGGPARRHRMTVATSDLVTMSTETLHERANAGRNPFQKRQHLILMKSIADGSSWRRNEVAWPPVTETPRTETGIESGDDTGMRGISLVMG